MAEACTKYSPDEAESSPDWFAVQVWARREFLCANQLRSRGYEVFLPHYKESRRWSDRIKVVECPLFAGYVFCRTPHNVAGSIITTPGVIRIIGDGRRPVAVAREEILAIRCLVDAGMAAQPLPGLHVGQRVRVLDGPLRDVEGVILRIKNRHCLVLSMSLLQRSVAVEIDSAWVSATPVH
jgi:transcription antitermination factor NusG